MSINSSSSKRIPESDMPRHPTSAEKFDLLKSLLREMFQLDRGDLDFGIYRIMNMKADEIETFLDKGSAATGTNDIRGSFRQG